MYRILTIISLILLPLSHVLANAHFKFTPEADDAYQKALSLRLNEARLMTGNLKMKEPNNLMVYYIENYVDFFTVFINEDKSEFELLEKNKDRRLSKIISDGNPDSPYYLYTQAEIKLQWAIARMKFGEYFTAFREVSSAYKLLSKNLKKFPDFIASKKSLGILHAIVGTIPDNYKWGVKLLSGMDGSIEQGLREVKEVILYARQHDFIFEKETLVMYAFLLLHLNNQSEEAWKIIQHGKLDAGNNPLSCFILANVAMHTGRNDDAITLLENRPKGRQFHAFYYLDFMLGLAKLYRQDPDADQYLKKYIEFFNGENYIKEAHQKLAWHYLLQNDKPNYNHYIAFCKFKGAANVGGDKAALREAESNQAPNPTLLKARLLFDGGYFSKAHELLNNQAVSNFTSLKDQLENTYRLGRITHRMKDYPQAIRHYQQTIEKGKTKVFIFACNAALQLGIIFENQNDLTKAEKNYRLSLSLKPSNYKSSLHQKAKAGLNRLKKK